MAERYDAVVVGAGPNGLAAAIEIARAGLSVLVLEANATIGGGARTEALTLPGFAHDVCSAIHPMARVSPYLSRLPLADFGLAWIDPPLALAHPQHDGSVAVLSRDLDETARTLGPDGDAWRSLFAPFVRHARGVFDDVLQPIRVPRHPILMARFGLTALQSCTDVVSARFESGAARALFAGCAAHAASPLDRLATASFGLVLALAGHAVGWPCARGGSAAITSAMARYLVSLGGEIRTSERVTTLAQMPDARAVIFDLVPRRLASIAASALPEHYVRRLESYRHGPGVFKVDWALDGPIPWRNRECLRAATVHLGGSYDEIVASEEGPWRGAVSKRPFVLVAQQSLFDDTRAPAGQHTGWAYCHVPHGSTVDMTDAIERQIERYAPGFRQRILARHTMDTAQLEAHNANMIGGDIGGGANDLVQLVARPVARWNPYTTPNPRLYLASSATPPGGGVHGMCGYWAARSALERTFGRAL